MIVSRYWKNCVTLLVAMLAVAAMSGCTNQAFLKDGCFAYVEGQTLGKTVGSFSLSNSNDDDDLNYILKVPEEVAQRYKFIRTTLIDPLKPRRPDNVQREMVPYSGSGELQFGGTLLQDGQFGDYESIEFALMEGITEEVCDMITVCQSVAFGDPLDDGVIQIKGSLISASDYEDAEEVVRRISNEADALAIAERKYGIPKGKLRRLSFGDQAARAATGNTQVTGTAPTVGSAPGGGGKQLTGFPCGQGANGYTVCAVMPAAQDTGDYLYIPMLLDGDVVLDDPTNFFTYAFVFDSDGDFDNNWEALPQFPNDFFQGTDRWYEVAYNPQTTAWQLIVRVADNTTITEVSSAAHAVIVGSTIVLAVPMSEFSTTDLHYRLTAFRHPGDFGQGGDWSADLDPDIDELLLPIEPIDALSLPLAEGDV